MPTIDLNPNLKNFLKTTTCVPLQNPRSNPLTPTFVNKALISMENMSEDELFFSSYNNG
jgi:hypothetical protein